jgi:protein involved in polysaccharide export with SLBB domain
MNNKKYIALSFLFSFLVTPAFAQVSELQLLSGLAQGMSDSGTGQMLDEQDPMADDNQTMAPKEESSFEDQNYSYTGEQDFSGSPQSKDLETPYMYFGYDFFNQAPSTFAQTNNVLVPSDYVIGSGDTIRIIMYGSQNSNKLLKVSREGEILIPEIGPISVAGLTFIELKESIKSLVKEKFIGTESTVTLGRLRSINVFVLGEAFQPGMYTVSSLTTLTNAIFKSGGIRSTGSLRDIQVKRRGELIASLDFYDLLLKGDTSNDISLLEGDVVFIPPITKTVGIIGEVSRPAIYELKENENLKDLISLSGNLKHKADLSSIELQRVTESGYDLLEISTKNEDFKLKSGDLIKVYPVENSIKNAVLLSGHVLKPGFYAWYDGMRIGDLMDSPQKLLSMTDVNYVLIKRLIKNSQNYDFIQVDLEKVFNNKLSSGENYKLFEGDELIFLPSLLEPNEITTRLIQDEYITIDGEEVLVDEWDSLTYLRRSLISEQEVLEAKKAIRNPVTGESMGAQFGESTEEALQKYYEYTIHDYCVVPKDLAILIIEADGFKAKKSIPLEDLEDLTEPQDFRNLLEEVERQSESKNKSDSKSENLSLTLTNLCRRQLMDPVINILRRQSSSNNASKIVSVYGSVHFPGEYPLTRNMKLIDAINSGGGLSEGAFDTDVELSRRRLDNKEYKINNIFASLRDESVSKIKLRSLDVVNVKQATQNIKTVTLRGEIFFPGEYPISENQTLTELIKRAGGTTQYASVGAAFFQRESLKKAESERIRNAKNELKRKIVLASQAGGIGQASLDSSAISQLTSLLVDDGAENNVMGRLVVDIQGMIDGYEADLILEDGDTIFIPKTQQSVSVIGEVYVQNSHLFKSDYSIKDYVNLSGGSNKFADENSIYIIKSNGKIISPSQISAGFFRSRGGSVEPGDTIVVPLQVQPFSGIKATSEVTSIIYQLGLAAAALNSITN